MVAMMSGLVMAGVNADQTLPYYAVLSTVAIHLTHQVGDMMLYAVRQRNYEFPLKDVNGRTALYAQGRLNVKCSMYKLSNDSFVHFSLFHTDLHTGHQQTRGLLEEICVKQKPWTAAVSGNSRWQFVERKKRDIIAK